MISASFPCESIKCHVHHGHFLLDIFKIYHHHHHPLDNVVITYAELSCQKHLDACELLQNDHTAVLKGILPTQV